MKIRLTMIVIVFMACFLPGAAGRDGAHRPLTIHLFYTATCGDCDEVRTQIQNLIRRYHSVQIAEYDLAEPENTELMIEYYTRYAVPEAQWQGTLAIFVAGHWWTDCDQAIEELESVLANPAVARAQKHDGEAARDDRLGGSHRAAMLIVGLLALLGACLIWVRLRSRLT